MSRIKSLFALLLCAISLCAPALAHPGRTDSQGGHHVRATGEYHYHHGYPAHQHTGGVCPYNFDDKTGQSSGTKGSGTSKKSSTTYIVSAAKEDEDDSLPSWAVWLIIVAFFFWPIIIIIPICLWLAVTALVRKVFKHKDDLPF